MTNHLKELVVKTTDRYDFWTSFINSHNLKNIAELGVWEGDFAEKILQSCPLVTSYTMVDPWRNLSDWNKPFNNDNETFTEVYQKAISRTDFAKEKRVVLRGKTIEVINDIPDDSLDFVYIDGDHTLKGITIDLINIWGKVKDGGFIGGDDLFKDFWCHGEKFEPTLVFPYTVYFAEAMNAKIYTLPNIQYLIQKQSSGFELIDLTGEYKNTDILSQLKLKQPKEKPPSLKKALIYKWPFLKRFI